MNITSFKLSQDKSKLQLFLENSSTATTLFLWTHKTYRTEGLEIDLSTKLTGASIQSIDITLADLGITEFDGVYFVEVGDGTNAVASATGALTRYKECVLDNIKASKDCESCFEINDPNTLNSHTLLTTLELALTGKNYQEILYLSFGLDKICTNGCKGCGEYKST